MKITRFALALVLTAALLYIARTNSRGRPEPYVHTDRGFTLEMMTVPKAYEVDTARITATIRGPFDGSVQPVLRHARFGQDETTPLYRYRTTPLEVLDSAGGRYGYLMTAGLKGGRFLYYIEVRDKIGGQRAVFLDGGRPFVMKYVGHVPTWLLLTHIALMFATVYFVVIGALHGARLTGGGTDVFPMARAYGIAALCAFLGGYPFGIPMNWFTFGTTWEGVPFGTDATDNKTQLLFVYLLLVVFAAFGSLTRRRVGRDAYPPRVLGWLGVLGFAVMLGIYLIPHSIQFSPALTRIVCWSFIGLAAAAYFGGLAAGIVRRRAPRAHKAERRAG